MRPSFCISACSALAVIALSLGTACGGDNSGAGGLLVDDLQLIQLPGGARIVSGVVRNTSPHVVGSAQIQISLFDSDNRRIDGMHVVVRDIPAGGEVRFRESVQSELEINGARVKSVIVIGG